MNAFSETKPYQQWIFLGFLCILACTYYYTFFLNSSTISLEIEVKQKSVLKLFWADETHHFSEDNSAKQRLIPSTQTYTFSVPGLADTAILRFDPMRYKGDAVVKRITISQRGYEAISVDLNELNPANQIEELSINADGLHFTSSGTDPFFLYKPRFVKQPSYLLNEFLVMAAICLVLIFFVSSWASLRFDFGYVPIMMSMVFVLVLTMAVMSQKNAHPDEYVHIAATDYYLDNWLPPEVDDETIAHTYSIYGQSRLNNGEIYYLFAGKVAKLFSAFSIENPLSSRLFNVLLFGLLVSYTLCSIPARAVAIPFLISPQIWYLFSYCNSDAFALFICFIIGCELVRKNSYLNRALMTESSVRWLFPALLIAILFALLFLLKKNYYPFVALVYFFLLLKVLSKDSTGHRFRLVFRILVLSAVAICFAGIRIGLDYYVNGTDRNEKLLVMQEKMAGKRFKPSTELAETHIYLYKKARGIPLKSLIVKDKWFGKTFKTGVGMYGYFTVIGPERYYEIMKWFAVVLLVYTLSLILIRGSTADLMLTGATLILSVALIGASLHHSWTMDFQAQGRYLFPILCMFGILVGRCRFIFEKRLFILSISQLYLLGLYLFIFVALMNIPRM